MKKYFLLFALMLLSFASAWADDPINLNQVTVNAGTSGGKQYTATIQKFVEAGQIPDVTAVTYDGGAIESGKFISTDEVYYATGANAGELFATYETDAVQGYYFLKVLVSRGTGEAEVRQYIFVPFIAGDAVDYLRVNSAATFAAAMVYNEQEQKAGGYWMYYQKYPWCDVWYTGDATQQACILYPGDQPNGTGNETPGTHSLVNASEDDKIAWYDNLVYNYGKTKITRNWNATGHPNSNPDNVVLAFPNWDGATAATVNDNITLGNPVWVYGDQAYLEPNYTIKPGKFTLASVANDLTPYFDLTEEQIAQDAFKENFSVLLVPTDANTVDLNNFEQAPVTIIHLTADNTTIAFDGDATSPYTYNGGRQTPKNLSIIYNDGTAANDLTNCDNDAVVFTVTEVYPYDDDDNDETNYEDAGLKPFGIVISGDYWGEFNLSYTIDQYDLSGAAEDDNELITVGYTSPLAFTGSVVKPNITVSALLDPDDETSGYDLNGDDFEILWPYETDDNTATDYISAGEKPFQIKGKGNFKGTSGNFIYEIAGRSITAESITVNYTAPDYTYSGLVQRPESDAIVITDAARQVDDPNSDDPTETIPYTLVAGTDYKLTYSDGGSVNAGDYTITITGLGDYATGEEANVPSVVLPYTIKKKPLADGMFTVYNNFTYDGKVHPQNVESQIDYAATDAVALTPGATPTNLLEGMYDVSYGDDENPDTEDNIEVGTWSVTFTAKPDIVEGQGGDAQVVWSNNYTGSITKEVRIVGAALWINAAQVEKIYGEEDPAPKFTVDANSPKQLARSTDYAAVMEYLTFNRYNGDNGQGVGEHNYYIAQVPPSQRAGLNYDILIKDNTSLLIIYKKDASITIEPTEKALGDAEPTFVAKNVEGIIESDLVVANPDAPVAEQYKILKPGVATITREAGETVGEYPFTVTSDNYDLTWTPENFTITPASAAGAGCTIADAVYNGEFQTPAVTVVLDSKTLVAGTDYQIVADSWANNKYVTPANPTNAQKMSCTVHFIGDYAGTPDATAYGKITKRPVVVVPSIKEGVNLETGYTFSTDDVELDYRKLLDNDNNSGLVDTKEFMESDANSFVRPVYEAQATADPTVFNIVKKTNGSSKNYEFQYVDGEYTIGRAVLTIRVSGTKKYGQDEEDAEWTITATGWKNGETEAQQQQYLHNDFGTDYFFEYERDVEGKENPEDVGIYDITITGPSVIGEEGNGYKVVYVDDKFNITKAPLTITAQPAEKYYSDDDPQADQGWFTEAVAWPATFTVDGLVNGDTEDDAQFYTQTYQWGQGWQQITYTVKYRTYTVTREPNEEIGEYVITGIAPTQYAEQSVLKNYDVTWKIATGAKLKIKPLDVTVKVSDATITYGQTYTPNIEVVTPANLSNARKAEVIDAIKAVTTGTPAVPVLAYAGIPTKTPINAGTYTITATGPAAAENFTVSAYNPGTLTVEPFELAVKANDQSIIYASEINPYDVTIGEVSYRLADDIFEPTGDKIKDVIALNTEITHVGTFTPEEEPYDYELNPNYVFAEEDDFEQGYLTIRRLDPLPLGAADLAAALNKTAEEWPLKQVLADHTGIEVNVQLPSDRSMVANDWYSWVLPFEVSPRMLSRDNTWGYAAVDILDKAKSKDNDVVFSLTVEAIPANTPFVVKVDQSISSGKRTADNKPLQMGDIIFNDVTIADFDYLNDEPKSASKDGSVEFIGVYELKNTLTANEWALNRKEAGAPRKFQPGPAESVSLTQTRAYLWTAEENSANVRIFVQEPDGTLTEITDVDADSAAEFAEGWYTINGVKLEGEPTVSGTYIYNGKKIFFQAK